MKTTILCLLFLITQMAFGVPEKELPEAWYQTILPSFQKMDSGEIQNSQGLRLRYAYQIHPDNHKTLVILPGRSELMLKYAELIYDLSFHGFNIFILSHQGQGESERLLKDQTRGHVIHFNDYVKDVEQWMNEVVIPLSPSGPRYLLAHSMGGAISAKYLALHQDHFQKAILSSPMLQINTAPYSESIARYYAEILMKLGKGKDYAPGWGPYDPNLDVFETNRSTRSEVRFNISKEISRMHPEFIVWAPTVSWVHQSLRATRKIHHAGKKIKTPILLFQSGKDEVVISKRQNSFCKRAPCELHVFPEASHEIFVERDELRDEAIKKVLNFLN